MRGAGSYTKTTDKKAGNKIPDIYYFFMGRHVRSCAQVSVLSNTTDGVVHNDKWVGG